MLAWDLAAGSRPQLQASPLADHSSCYPCHVQLSAWVFHASFGVWDMRVGRCAPLMRVVVCSHTLEAGLVLFLVKLYLSVGSLV